MIKKFTKRLWEKKNSQKGFTLVELIVVLVILAILAAMMVPALTGWINRAKEKQVALNARSVYLATQTLVSEEYAKASPVRDTNVGRAGILDLAEIDDVANTISFDIYYGSATTDEKGYYQVKGIDYTENGLSYKIGDTSVAANKVSY